MYDKVKNFFNNRFNVAAFLIFAVVIFSLYGKSLFFDWTYYDDDVLILDKQDYLAFSNIKNIFKDTVFGQETDKFCRPLLNLTFLAEKYLYGINPEGYHITNILIHLFTVFSIFIFLTLKYDREKTFMLCLLFACHPAIVQAVSWIPGRNDSMLTLFVVLSFYFLVKYFDDGKKTFYVLHLCFFALSLLTKETAAVTPLFYFVFFSYKKQNLKKTFHFVIFWFFITAVYLMYRNFVLSYQPISLNFHMLIKNFVFSLSSLTKYFANIFFPVKLSVFPSRLQTDFFLCIASICMFVLLFLKFKGKYDFKTVLFGFGWFFVFLFPTFLMPENHFYDHRIYLSLIGILIVLLEIINKYDKINKIIFVSLPFFLFFCVTAYFYENKFENREVFWVNAFISSPDSDITNAMVAGLFMERKMYGQAEERYLKAIELNKNFSKHYVNLAVLYTKTGDLDKAEKMFLNALFSDKNNPNIYYNLALLYKYKGDTDKALQMKEKYVEIFNETNKVSKIRDINL